MDWRQELLQRVREIRRRQMRDTTIENVTNVVREILAEQLPKLVSAVQRAHAKGGLTVKIDLEPDKKLAERVCLSVTPKLTLPGVGAVWDGQIDIESGEAQLSLLSAFDEAA